MSAKNSGGCGCIALPLAGFFLTLGGIGAYALARHFGWLP
jgi:hypothetical protein